MVSVIDNIIKENIDYYRRIKTNAVAWLLINERGALITKKINGKLYFYLRKKSQGKFSDRYIGPEGDDKIRIIRETLKQRKTEIQNLRQAKYALKRLGSDNMNQEDFPDILHNLFKAMDFYGLWDQCLELIGSWCFKVYQSHLGVESYPFRTVDIDLAVRLPYRGDPVDIGSILKELGFREDFNLADETIIYKSGELMVEFLKDRGQRGKTKKPYLQDLGIAPQSLPYLKILLENPVILKIRDLGKVTVPSLPAFVVHKLIVSSDRKDQTKKTKDYQQALSATKVVLRNQEYLEQMESIVGQLNKTWRGKMIRSLRKAPNFVSEAKPFAILIQKMEEITG